MTREPNGHPEADGAWGPSGPPRPRPSRAETGPLPRTGTGPFPRTGTGPFPRAATGPPPRVPAAPDRTGADPWSGTAPGFEFEGRRSRPARDPAPQPGRGRDPQSRPGREGPRDTQSEDSRRRAAAFPVHADGKPAAVGAAAGRGPTTISPPCPDSNSMTVRSPAPRSPPDPARTRVPRPGDAKRARRRRPSPSGPNCSARCCPSRSNAAGPRSSWPRLEFRGWGVRVAIPILAMVVFGVAVVVIAGANSGNAGPTPPAASLGFPPAALAGNDFTVAASEPRHQPDAGPGDERRRRDRGGGVAGRRAHRAGAVLRVAQRRAYLDDGDGQVGGRRRAAARARRHLRGRRPGRVGRPRPRLDLDQRGRPDVDARRRAPGCRCSPATRSAR